MDEERVGGGKIEERINIWVEDDITASISYQRTYRNSKSENNRLKAGKSRKGKVTKRTGIREETKR